MKIIQNIKFSCIYIHKRKYVRAATTIVIIKRNILQIFKAHLNVHTKHIKVKLHHFIFFPSITKNILVYIFHVADCIDCQKFKWPTIKRNFFMMNISHFWHKHAFSIHFYPLEKKLKKEDNLCHFFNIKSTTHLFLHDLTQSNSCFHIRPSKID